MVLKWYNDNAEQIQRVRKWSVELFLVVYLLFVGLGSTATLVANFPLVSDAGKVTFPCICPETQADEDDARDDGDEDDESYLTSRFCWHVKSSDQGFLLLALVAGVTGSFIHAAQSFGTFLGNCKFKQSWAVWYIMRPWIGGVLGLSIYVAFRAGMFASNGNGANPYGVVALGLLGGWFSKTTTDKMQEVFETMFKTDQDKLRKDKLNNATPVLTRIDPSPVPQGVNEITIVGAHFHGEATVLIAGEALTPTSPSESELKVSLTKLAARPAAGTEVTVVVHNPEGLKPDSNEVTLKFE